MNDSTVPTTADGKALTLGTAISCIVGPRLGLSEQQLANLEFMIRNSGRRKVGRGALRNVIVRLQSEKNHDSRVVESHTAEHVFALTL